MKKSNVRVKPCGFKRRGSIVCKQCVNKRDEGVYVVRWWAPIPASKEKLLFLLENQSIENGEITSSSFSLDTADFIQSYCIRKTLERLGNQIGGMLQLFCIQTYGIVTNGTLNDPPRIEQFSANVNSRV